MIQSLISAFCLLPFQAGDGFSSSPSSETDKTANPARAASITLALGGDVMLGRLVDEAAGEHGVRYVWGDILPLIQRADLALVNLECVIATGGAPFVPPRTFYFRASPNTGEALRLAGIDHVSLANNHAMDFQAPALLETIRRLDEMGVAHSGAGANRQAAAQPAILEATGVKIGVVSFADHFSEYAATSDAPGTNIIEITTKGKDFQRVESALRSAREQGADLVVFSIHWGPNMRQEPTRRFVQFAHAVMDAGADIFHGHSAHIFQGIEVHHGKPILYDTGDLLDDYYVDPALRNDQQLLFFIKIRKGQVQEVDLVPLLIDRMQVNLARGEDFEAIAERIARLSGKFGTTVRREGERLWVEMD